MDKKQGMQGGSTGHGVADTILQAVHLAYVSAGMSLYPHV